MKHIPSLSYRYAKALFLSIREDELEKINNCLSKASGMINVSEIREILIDPTLTKRKVLQLFLNVFDDIPDVFKNFLRIIIDRRRLDYLPEIEMAFKQIMNESVSKIEVKVRTALEIADSEKKEIENLVKSETGRESILSVYIDDDLLAGMIIEFSDRVIDMTVKGRLERFEKTFSAKA
ncbi:MAG: ATP synthase F1 subunit delta [Kosmotogaceae bacterium]